MAPGGFGFTAGPAGPSGPPTSAVHGSTKPAGMLPKNTGLRQQCCQDRQNRRGSFPGGPSQRAQNPGASGPSASIRRHRLRAGACSVAARGDDTMHRLSRVLAAVLVAGSAASASGQIAAPNEAGATPPASSAEWGIGHEPSSGVDTSPRRSKSLSADSSAAPWRWAQAAISTSAAGTVTPRARVRRARLYAADQTSASMGRSGSTAAKWRSPRRSGPPRAPFHSSS